MNISTKGGAWVLGHAAFHWIFLCPMLKICQKNRSIDPFNFSLPQQSNSLIFSKPLKLIDLAFG